MVAASKNPPPSPQDAELAKKSIQKLAPLARTRFPLAIRIASAGGRSQEITLPKPAVRVLVELLSEISKGNAVTLVPHEAHFTTQQAAEFLGVSRPFIVKELKQKKIPFRKVGTHRRILFKDLLVYRQKSQELHDRSMNELVREAQELGLGY